MRERTFNIFTNIKVFFGCVLTLLLSNCSYDDNRPSPLSNRPKIPSSFTATVNSDELSSLQSNYHDPDEAVLTGDGTKKNQQQKIFTEKRQVNKPDMALPIQNKIPESENSEEVLISEQVYIPSALQTTPVDEIEIVGDAKPDEAEIKNSKKANENIITDDEGPKPLKKVKIRPKDTLYSIAKQYNVPVYYLAWHNKIEAPFLLKTGSFLEIPDENVINPKPKLPPIINNLNEDKTFIETPKTDFVVVHKKDTLYSIAKSNNIPLRDLILRNNLNPPFKIAIGDKIYLPNTAFHVVNKNDTVYSISKRYNVSLNSLVKLNKIDAPFKLVIGQKVMLPAAIETIEKTKVSYVVRDKKQTLTITNEKQKPQKKEITTVKVAKKVKIVTPSKNKTPTREQKEIVDRIIVKPEPLTSSSFAWPAKGRIISEYNVKTSGLRNNGINISGRMGDDILAANNGIVAYAGNELKGLGNLVIIKHDKGFMTVYAHNETILVKKGQQIARGEKIATLGNTGRVSTPQLHFEIRRKTKSINPRDLLK